MKRINNKQTQNWCHCISFRSVLVRKEPFSGIQVAWNSSGGRVTLSVCFLHLVCRLRCISVGAGAAEVIERCAEWITFPGNSCQICQSRVEERKAARSTEGRVTEAVGVAGLSAELNRLAQGSVMGGHTELLDGGLGTWGAHCLTHCSSLFFPRMQIARTAVHHMQAQQRPGTPPLSRCHPVTQHLSMVQLWPWQGMQTPWRGLAVHPLSAGTLLLDLAACLFNDCISILRQLTGTLSGPTVVPLQYQNVSMSRPRQRPLLSPLT